MAWHREAGPIPNLAQAARRADGRIEYGSEFEILAPEQPSAGNRVLLFDVENRGHPVTNGLYNTPVDPAGPQPDIGNGFLEDNGYTVVSIHWEDGHGIRLPTYPGAGGKPAPLLAVGFAVIYIPVIASEERFLRDTFPGFEDYCRRVPRLLPRFTPAKAQDGQAVPGDVSTADAPDCGFSFALYRKHREYNAALGAALLYLSLLYLRPALEALLNRFR